MSVLDSYEEIAFKAVVYPIIKSLYDASDELSAAQVKEDCEENCLFFLDWIERLETITRSARKNIEDYTAQLGYNVVNSSELEISENF